MPGACPLSCCAVAHRSPPFCTRQEFGYCRGGIERTYLMVFTLLPLWLSGTLLVCIPTLLAMGGPVLIRRRLSLERLRTNNEVAGFKFATVGVLYAVLLAFAVIVVWEKFGDAENHVAEEAGAAANIYRLSAGLEKETGA